MVLTKKQLIILFAILIFLLVSLLVLGFNAFWALFIMFPISVCVDICYIALPITILAMIILSIYSHIKKDFVKFNHLYQFLAFMLVIGFMDICLESAIKTRFSFYEFDYSLGIIYLIAFLVFVLNIIFITRKKDTRLFSYLILPIFLLYLLYKYIELVGI